MPAGQLAFVAAGPGEEERHATRGCSVNPDLAQLRIIGEFISPERRVGSPADAGTPSRPIA